MNFIKNLYRRIRNFVANQFAKALKVVIDLTSTVSNLKLAGQEVGFTDYLKVAAGFALGAVVFTAWYFFIYGVRYVVTTAVLLLLALVLPVEIAVLLALMISGITCVFFLFNMIDTIANMVHVKLIVNKVVIPAKKEVALNDFVAA